MDRNTRQRQAVLSVIAHSGLALTPPEICERAQVDVPRLSLSTVYRRLKDLVDEGEVLRVELAGQPSRFEAGRPPASRSAPGHHHHFHCTGCDGVYPIHACPGPMTGLAPRGFKVESHEITLHGRCPGCARTGAST